MIPININIWCLIRARECTSGLVRLRLVVYTYNWFVVGIRRNVGTHQKVLLILLYVLIASRRPRTRAYTDYLVPIPWWRLYDVLWIWSVIRINTAWLKGKARLIRTVRRRVHERIREALVLRVCTAVHNKRLFGLLYTRVYVRNPNPTNVWYTWRWRYTYIIAVVTKRSKRDIPGIRRRRGQLRK